MNRFHILELARELSIASDDEVLSDPRMTSFRLSEGYVAIDAVWRAQSAGLCVDSKDAGVAAQYDLPTYILYLRDKQAFRNTLPIKGKVEDPIVDPAPIRKFVSGFLDLDYSRVFSPLLEANFASDDARKTIENAERFVAYQGRIVEDREFLFRDPTDGVMRKARDSWIYYGRGIYMFGGPNPFFILTGGAGQKALAVFVPKISLIIDFGAGNTQFLKPLLMARTFGFHISRIARNPELYNACIQQGEDDIIKEDITVAMGQIDNFAHHLWNHFPVLDRIVNAGLASTIDRVLSFGTEFFGSVSELYPELSDRHVGAKKAAVIDKSPFNSSYLLIQPGGYFISDALKERLVNRAVSHTGSAPDVSDEQTVVWFGLRYGSRAWIQQEKELSKIISVLHSRYPSAVFVLDGFTCPVGADYITSKWQGTIDRIKVIVQELIASAPDTAHIIDLVGADLFEAVLWADRSDIYVAPIGTTQHKVGWFSKGKGLIYSGPDIEKTRPLRRPGCWEAESIVPATYIIGELAEMGERRTHNDQRSNLDNIVLDTDDLLQRLLDMMAETEARRVKLHRQ